MPITAATLKARLAGMLKEADADALKAYWTDIVADSLSAASGDVVSALSVRGYSVAQIAAWDRNAEFVTDIGLFWCLVKGAGLASYDDRFIARLDRRAELKEVGVTVDGAVVTPAGRARIGYGPLDDSRQTFKRQIDDGGNLCEVKF